MNGEANEQWRAVVSKSLDNEPFHPLSSRLAVEVAGASVAGRRTSHNTDHYLAVRLGRMQETLTTSLAAGDLPPSFEEYGYALLVADGLGGQGAGARASRVALSALAHLSVRHGRWNVRIGPENLAEIAEQGELFLRQAHDAVRAAALADPQLADMATSLTALYIAEGSLFIAHVGHSRAFLFRNGNLMQLTTDQTLEQDRRDANGPRPLDRAKRDASHLVTEAVGAQPTGPDVAIEHITLSSGDRLLLCTNGLTDVVSDDQIADQLAQQRSPADDCQQLIDLARAEGSPDDVTVLVADYRLRDQASRSEPVPS